MQIVLKHNIYPIKNGYAAQSPELGLTAHGYSPEVAKLNLERVSLMFFKPFERQGNLEQEIQILGLTTEKNGTDLAVSAM